MVKIGEIKEGAFDEVAGAITEKKEFETKTGLKGASCTLDDGDQISLMLWGDDADLFAIGDAITLKNGFCRKSTEKDSLSISKSKFGGSIEKS